MQVRQLILVVSIFHELKVILFGLHHSEHWILLFLGLADVFKRSVIKHLKCIINNYKTIKMS